MRSGYQRKDTQGSQKTNGNFGVPKGYSQIYVIFAALPVFVSSAVELRITSEPQPALQVASQVVTMMLFMSVAPSAFSPVAGGMRVHSARPTMQPAPQMVVGEFSTVSMSTIYAVEQNLPAVLLAKSGADELLDEFASVFPIVFVGALLVGFGYQYVKNTIKREELSITLPELPDNAGTLFLYALWLAPIGAIGLVFANDAGLPVPSPEKLLSPVTYVLNTGMGLLAKTSMDVWNTAAPVIGLGQAKLNY